MIGRCNENVVVFLELGVLFIGRIVIVNDVRVKYGVVVKFLGFGEDLNS